MYLMSFVLQVNQLIGQQCFLILIQDVILIV